MRVVIKRFLKNVLEMRMTVPVRRNCKFAKAPPSQEIESTIPLLPGENASTASPPQPLVRVNARNKEVSSAHFDRPGIA